MPLESSIIISALFTVLLSCASVDVNTHGDASANGDRVIRGVEVISDSGYCTLIIEISEDLYNRYLYHYEVKFTYTETREILGYPFPIRDRHRLIIEFEPQDTLLVVVPLDKLFVAAPVDNPPLASDKKYLRIVNDATKNKISDFVETELEYKKIVTYLLPSIVRILPTNGTNTKPSDSEILDLGPEHFEIYGLLCDTSPLRNNL